MNTLILPAPGLILILVLHFVASFPGDQRLEDLLTQKSPAQPYIKPGKIGETSYESNWCGFRRNLSNGHNTRRKRFVLQGSRWKVNPVTYRISTYPPTTDLSREMVDREIDAAFRMWEDVCNLTFKRVREGKVNIDIRFLFREHGDEEPFDGRGGMTAHAYYPFFGGDIHFDAEEKWTANSHSGINLFQVATHEIGHALGLEHTRQISSVMSPYYLNYDPNFKMHPDDIAGIQKLYGPKSYSVCDHPKIDAAVTMVDGATYLFKGNLVYKMANLSTPSYPDYPKEISKVFESLHGPIDAAFTRANGVTYIFKGDEFWRLTNMSLDRDFPQKIQDFFPNIPTPLDAAVVFPRDENIYFMKGRNYWRFDARKSPSVSPDYPKSIIDWQGIPVDLDAAVRLEENGYPVIYFFKGHNYWKFNDRSFSVFIANPPFPRNIRSLINGCKDRTNYM